ncbi:MAG: glycosyltransferase family 2 protein [Acetobacteraceae bacterium]
MRLTAVSKVLDEADIIEAFVRHTAAFVSHQIILDNGSCDGTVEILKHLRDEGLHLTLLQNHCRQFNEKKLNTVLYHLAVQLGAPDWVLFLDADEFIDDREAVRGGGGLAALLEGQPAEVLCVHVLLSHYQASIWDNLNEPIIPVRLSWRQERRAVEKAMVRGNLAARNVDILPGNLGSPALIGLNLPSRWRTTPNGRRSRPLSSSFVVGPKYWQRVSQRSGLERPTTTGNLSRSCATDRRTCCDRPGCIGSASRRTD